MELHKPFAVPSLALLLSAGTLAAGAQDAKPQHKH